VSNYVRSTVGNNGMDIFYSIPVLDLWGQYCRTRFGYLHAFSTCMHFIYCTAYIGFC